MFQKSTEKSDLRTELIAKRLAVSPEYAAEAALKLSENMLAYIPKNAVVAGYISMRCEIDVLPLLRNLSERGNKICLPVALDDTKILKFLAWQPDTQLISGKYGVLCPPDNSPTLTPDFIITPLVGFDLNGNRLGYGGGYYDATIRELRVQNPNLQVIGAGYKFQQVENLPREEHDERLDRIITE